MIRNLFQQAARILLVAVSLSISGCFLYGWMMQDSSLEIAVSLPGGDGRPESADELEKETDLEGVFTWFADLEKEQPGLWPRFRGKNFDNICQDGPPLASKWSEDGPAELWSVALGEGYAAPVVQNGRVYLLDYDEELHGDVVRCFSLDNGRELWRRFYEISVKRNHGMSRTVPAVTESLLVTVGPRCHVLCLDPENGDFRWGMDLQREYGVTEPLWYTGQCPLIDDGAVILAAGGPDALLVAVDGMTGDILWKTPNPREWAMSHSSIIPLHLAGVKTYVYCTLGAVIGVAAEGSRRGEVLWEVPWKARVIAPSAVQVDEKRFLVTAGYGEGSLMIAVVQNAGDFEAEVLYAVSPKEGIACEQQTPIFSQGLLYTVMPKDAAALREQFACYHPDGQLIWSSGPDNRFGLGPYMLADNKFFVLSDDGVLTMMARSTEKFEALDSRRVLTGNEAWGPLALAGTRMLLRDSQRLICLEMGAESGEEG
ncbi:MAG: PQQ-binding-like beta-propeller repeat protein [Candidatus Hydrogenedens sp.]|nr:PQQ-binding-like beta-propeller repeat protein [Candidatus Hydrogenedens sp.]